MKFKYPRKTEVPELCGCSRMLCRQCAGRELQLVKCWVRCIRENRGTYLVGRAGRADALDEASETR